MNGKRICRRGLVLAVVSLFVAALAGVAWADVIDIPDQTLASAIRSQLNLPPDQPITDAEMLNLTGLSTGGEASLQGLQYARNLQALSLIRCQDALDLSPLAGLPLLSEVDLSHCDAPDLSALATLPSLSYLDMLGNRITQLPNLANCPDLSFIGAPANRIADISALTSLTHLQELDLNDNPLNYDAYAIDIPIIIANNPGINISYDAIPEPPASCYALGLLTMLSLSRLAKSRFLNNELMRFLLCNSYPAR
jgi:Leucine-rich repeat (LRR) protein